MSFFPFPLSFSKRKRPEEASIDARMMLFSATIRQILMSYSEEYNHKQDHPESRPQGEEAESQSDEPDKHSHNPMF